MGQIEPFGDVHFLVPFNPSGIKTKQYEYDTNNRLLLSFDDNSSTYYSYDKAGNLINKIYELSGRETESFYGYDGYNRLCEYISGNTTAEYTYNPEGLRESKTVNGNTTRFIYDGANIVGELTNDNYYIYYRGTELIGSKGYDKDGYYYRLDSHGNVTALTDELGENIKSYTYNAYGKEQPFTINPSGNQSIIYQWKNETESTHNPFRYCGEYYDEESGLLYLRNRYYDPSIGRFITEDPIRDGLNWYVYCGNNPVMFVDPSGLKPGDLFVDPDLAALDFAILYNEKSINHSNQDLRDQNKSSYPPDGCEYASIIYTMKTSSGIMYSYAEPVFRNADGDPTLSVNAYECILPSEATQYGIIHTHGARGYEKISKGPDKSVYGRSENKINYLVTPRGYIKRYIRNTEDRESILRNYRVYANTKDILFEQSASLLEYKEQYSYTREIYSAYENLSNKLIWKLFLNTFSNKHPLEIVEMVYNTNSSYEAFQQLQKGD